MPPTPQPYAIVGEHTRKTSRSAERQALAKTEDNPSIISSRLYAIIFITAEGRQEMFAYTNETAFKRNVVYVMNKGGRIVWMGMADMPSTWTALPLPA